MRQSETNFLGKEIFSLLISINWMDLQKCWGLTTGERRRILPRSARRAVALALVLAAGSAIGQAAGKASGAPESAAQAGSKQNAARGTLHGVVSTKQDNVLSGIAGISVKLTAKEGGGAALSADTDDTGRYEFRNLAAGTYTLSVALPGFKAVTRQVEAGAGIDLAQDITLEIETVSEKVEVNEETQNVTTENVSTPTETVTSRQILSLPTASGRVIEVLPVTPGVVRTQNGKLNFKGADENQSLLLVNSARTTDPVTGSFSISLPADAVQSFAVYKTPYDAGLGSFSGGLTAIETKPPEDHWNFNLKSFVPSILGKQGSIVGLAEAQPGVDFGGPLYRKKLFFSEVFKYDMKKISVRGLPWPNDITKRQGFNSFTTLEAILSDHQVMTLTVNAFPQRIRYADINALVPEPASNDLSQSGVAVYLADKYQFDSGAILSAIAQYTRFDSTGHGQGIADMLVTPEGWGGNFFNRWSRRGKEFQFVPTYQFSEKDFWGRHQIRVGVDVDHRAYTGTNVSHPVQLLREDGTLAEQIDFDGAPPQDATDTAVAEFVQDHWILNPHWSIDLGGRFSTETTGWSAAFAPRAGIAYSPDKAGRTVIRAGAGFFYSLLPLMTADFLENPTRIVSQFDPTGVLIGAPVTYENAYVGSGNPLAGVTLPGQPSTTPRNFTWNAEVDHRLRRNVSLRSSYIDSHTTYLFVVNPFTNTLGGTSFLGLMNNGSSTYREFENTVHFSIGERHEVNASYIWSQTRGDLNNLSSVLIPFAEPVIRPNVYGILPQDIPNRIVTWGIFSLPREFKFSPIFDVHTGYPYSNVDVAQDYVGTPNGQRFATYLSLDIKIYRQFKIPFLGNKNGKTHHIRLGFYSLNVTNHGNFHDVYNNVTSPLFGQFAGFLDRRDGAIIDFVD